jgi:hypothetical protein
LDCSGAKTQAPFKIRLSNWFQLLQELIEDKETDIETQWEVGNIFSFEKSKGKSRLCFSTSQTRISEKVA